MIFNKENNGSFWMFSFYIYNEYINVKLQFYIIIEYQINILKLIFLHNKTIKYCVSKS